MTVFQIRQRLHTSVTINVIVEGSLIVFLTILNEWLIIYDPYLPHCRVFLPNDEAISYPAHFSRIHQYTAIITTLFLPILILSIINFIRRIIEGEDLTSVKVNIFGVTLFELQKSRYLSMVYYINYYWGYLCLSFMEFFLKTYLGIPRPSFIPACGIDKSDIVKFSGEVSTS